MMGWYTHNLILIQINPAFAPMQYNTAMGFLLAGIALLALLASFRSIAGIIGAGTILIGVLTLLEYALGIDLFIDQMFMQHYIEVATSNPGRMAPNTALCFVLTGLALSLSGLKPDYALTPIWVSTFGAIIIALGTVALTGYLTGMETAYGWGQLTKMAIHTSGGFLLLGIGLAAYAWHMSKKSSIEMPYWLPIFAGIGCMTLTVSLWQALDATEQHLPLEYASASAIHADEGMLIFGIFLTIALVLAIWFAETSQKQLRIATRAREDLINSEAFTKAVVETAADGIISINASGIIETFNPAAEKIFGFSASEITGCKVNMLMPEPHRSKHDAYIDQYQKTGKARVLGLGSHEFAGMRKDGSTFPFELSLAAMMDRGQQKFTGVIRDISERKQMQNKIERMAYYDPLTGLPNRSLHYDRLNQALAQGRRNKHDVALLFLDLDHFKPINDNLGHKFGDQALITVANRLQNCIQRETDTASRIGGDEFGIILGSIDSEENACKVAEKILTSVSEEIVLNDTTYTLGCSIGIHVSHLGSCDVESMMTASDNAMYQAKKNGRNCYQITGVGE